MKFKSGRIFAAATSGLIALGALTGVPGAAPASAASYTHLCIHDFDGVKCAYAQGSERAIVVRPLISSTTNWIYPMQSGQMGEIRQANTNLCMQWDDADNEVREAPCIADAAEEWINHYDSTTHRTQFISQWWRIATAGANDCLDGAGGIMGTGLCTTVDEPVQDWGTS